MKKEGLISQITISEGFYSKSVSLIGILVLDGRTNGERRKGEAGLEERAESEKEGHSGKSAGILYKH